LDDAVDDHLVHRVLGQPLRGEAAVEDAHRGLQPRLRCELLQAVERIRGSLRTAGRRAQQREAFDALRRGDRDLLGDHAAEADADDCERRPCHVVGKRQGIGGVVGHRVRPGWNRGAPQPPLVGRDGVGRLGERLHQHARGRQRGSGSVEEEQRPPVTLALEVDVDPIESGGRHLPDAIGRGGDDRGDHAPVVALATLLGATVLGATVLGATVLGYVSQAESLSRLCS
jgi:hypothetical protein